MKPKNIYISLLFIAIIIFIGISVFSLRDQETSPLLVKSDDRLDTVGNIRDDDGDDIPNWLEEILGTDKNERTEEEEIINLSNDITIEGADENPSLRYTEANINLANDLINFINNDERNDSDSERIVEEYVSRYTTALFPEDFEVDVSTVETTKTSLEEFEIQFIALLDKLENIGEVNDRSVFFENVIEDLNRISVPEILKEDIEHLINVYETIRRIEVADTGALANNDPLASIAFVSSIYTIFNIRNVINTQYHILNEV